MVETRSTCPYCGVGCGVVIESQGNQITGVRGDPDHPANGGRLCSKGSTLHLTAAAPVTLQRRLRQPLRRAQRGGPAQALSWDEALDDAADRFAGLIGQHGPDAVGLYLSGQLLTEDYYVFNKLMKGLVGSNNVDTNSRLCMSSAVAGYKLTLGADAPPCSYEDLDQAGTVFITGSNMAWAHPILFRRLEAAKRARPQMKIIVADPRRTETAGIADLFLPLLPGSDVALYHGMLHLMLWEGLTDTAYIAAHTTGFDALRDRVREYTPKEVARLTGLKADDIVAAARWFGAGPTLSLYCQGLNQSRAGTDKNGALINLHLATGQIGRPGAGPFSLTGQPNAMGGREVGGLANQLSAHRDLANPAHRAEVARLWGVPDVPATPGKTAVEMFEAAADGQIKALWIACTNPAHSLPDQATVRRALQRCEYVVLQEAFADTATAPYADLLLPASSWGEKDGTVTNSERRISRVRRAVAAPGQARDDWAIAADFGRRLQARLHPDWPPLFAFDDAESVWREHRESTRGRDLDISGLDWARLDRQGPQQWPFAEGASTGLARLYTDGRFATDDGRARFLDAAFVPLAEPRDARFPFSLLTGRLRDQWHGMSRTGTVGQLFGHAAEPTVDLNVQDMARLKLADGDLVELASRRGRLCLPARTSADIAPAQAFVAMHWGAGFLAGAGVNELTSPARCPRSQQPELKHTAVRLAPARLPWRLAAATWCEPGQLAPLQAALRPWLDRFPFAVLTPFGRERQGLLLRAAATAAPADDLVDRLEALLSLRAEDGPRLHYADPQRGQRRSLRLQADGSGWRIAALLLVGDGQLDGQLVDFLRDEQGLQQPALVLRGQAAGETGPARGRQICNCFDVREAQIVEVLARGGPDPLRNLQQSLRCGTQCGSCLPELQRLARQALAA